MPARLDHDQRRTDLAMAVWRVIRREGVRGASVRGVAREAGLSMGSVRYFFDTQEALLRFAMRNVAERAAARIEAAAAQRPLGAAGSAVETIAQMLEQALPLDQERLGEAEVWFAFTGQGTVDPALARIRREADQRVRLLCAKCLRDLGEIGLIAQDRDVATEVARLWALLDGLTLHILLERTPDSAPGAGRILRSHLNDLRHPGA